VYLITDEQRLRFASKTRQADSGCIEWRGSLKSMVGGQKTYGQFWCGRLGADGRMRLAHRVAWEMANGPAPEGLMVMHSCDNPLCVNVAHLSLGTAKDNTADMISKGRKATTAGEAHGGALLTTAQALAIRELRSRGVPRSRVAALFEVSERTIGRITNRQGWKHV
jgi:hypothetical protein